MSFLKKSAFIQVFSFIFCQLTLAEPPLCQITPVKKHVKLVCEHGESTLTLGEEQAEIESDETYRLNFSRTLFNTPRVVRIHDKASKDEVLCIDVKEGRHAHIVSRQDDFTWDFNGLAAAKLKGLSIRVHGTLVIRDAIQLEEDLKIHANSLYLLNPFSLLNGHFSIRYQTGFLSGLSFPFLSKQVENYTVLNSLSSVRSPSQRRVQLDKIPFRSHKVQLKDFEAVYKDVFKRDLNEEIQVYAKKTSDEKVQYIKTCILARLTDNIKKGEIGELLHRRHMANAYLAQFLDSKVGLNSFDAIHSILEDDNSVEPKEIHITEVKYAKNGKPVLGSIKLDGRDWRQLSLPYVQNKLDRMLVFDRTKSISEFVGKNLAKVKLKLCVFNPNDFTMRIYDVGDMKQSLLD